MKKFNLESLENGMKNFIELFNQILEQSDYQLNTFVKGKSFVIPDEMKDDFADTFTEFLDLAPKIYKEIEDKSAFWKQFETLEDYEKNRLFLQWLRDYVENALIPYEEAAFLRKMDPDQFQNMSEYCFQNLILKHTGKQQIKKSGWEFEQIKSLRKILFYFIEQLMVDHLSKEDAIAHMEEIFGIPSSLLESWWKYVEKHEEKLWKIIVTRQYKRMENKLDRILDLLED